MITIFYVPCPEKRTATKLAEHLLEKKLIACSNIFPITSIYNWEGTTEQGEEWILLLKTQTSLEARIREELAKEHPYKTPAILSFQAEANPSFSSWVTEQTQE